ncbi:hypothetical protein J596_2733 [Acinetobacter baumannii 21072]|uniref:Uncharacterized protein n=1 Tax=Acinetobacter baumannii 21072 TaxID=1310697 RepID=A0A062IGH3_ACIBA|nr:hypothetical protein [Acinetobacter baumannii]KCY17627.1 hypothetical protein J596_2733 [Acinetobacter baumannii 21072]
MLFNNDEIENLNFFREIALVLEGYDIKFKNDNILIDLQKKYSVNVNHNLLLLKNIINFTDSIIISNHSSYSEVSSFIYKFEEKLKNNINNVNNMLADYTYFTRSFFSHIVWFLDKVRDWQEKHKISNNNVGVISASSSFIELYGNAIVAVDIINSTAKKGYDESNNKLIVLEDRLNNLANSFTLLNDDYKNNKNENFERQINLFKERADEAFFSYQSSLNDLKNHYQGEVEPQINELKNNLKKNKTELETLLGDVKLYQDKMTNKAVSEMSAHYFDKSKFERNSYFAITLVSAIIIIFSVISAYIGVNSYYNEYVSTKSCDSSQSRTIKVNGAIKEMSFEECMKDLSVKREATQKYAFNYLIFRLSFSLLLFLAVIYASRIAMRAYNHWRQSENMYLKLNTLSPFIGSLDKSVRNDVHLSLVPDYFGKDAGMVESSKDLVKDLPTNISNIAIKAIEQAGNTIGNKLGNDKESKNSDSESSTEKNKKKSADDSE